MSRKGEYLDLTGLVIEAFNGDLIRISQRSCVSGLSDLIAWPDVLTYLVAIDCDCGSQVASLLSIDRRQRTGKPAFYCLQALIVEDSTTRPVGIRTAETAVDLNSSLVAACPAHGRQLIDVASLLKHARKVETRIARGGQKMQDSIALGEESVQKFILPRVSL